MSKKIEEKKVEKSAFGGIFWVFVISLMLAGAVLFYNRQTVVDFILDVSRSYIDKPEQNKRKSAVVANAQIEALKADLTGQIESLKSQMHQAKQETLSSPLVVEKINAYEEKIRQIHETQRQKSRFVVAVSALEQAIEFAKPYPLEVRVVEETMPEHDELAEDLLPFFKSHSGVGVPSYAAIVRTYQQLIEEESEASLDTSDVKWFQELKMYFSSLIKVKKRQPGTRLSTEDAIEEAFILQDYERALELAKKIDRDDRPFEMWVKSLELRLIAEQKIKQLQKIALENLVRPFLGDSK